MRNIIIAGTLVCATAFAGAPLRAQDTADAGTTDTGAAEATAPKADASTVLAVVNGTEITLGHVILLRTQLPEQYLNAPDEVLFPAILDQLIDQTLLGNTVSGETLEMRLSLENEARALRAAEAIRTLVDGVPDEAALKAAYDAAVADLPEVQEYNASHILVETEDEAKALVEELQAGADFATLAKEKSTGPSGPNGGELGWFSTGMMVPEFENAVVALEVGAVSEPVQTQFGWHVIRLNGKRVAPPPSFEELAPQLTQQLQTEALDAAIADLRANADVQKMVDGFDPAQIRDTGLLNP